MELCTSSVDEQTKVSDELSSNVQCFLSWFSCVIAEEIDGGTSIKTSIECFLLESIGNGSVCESILEGLSNSF